MDVMKQAEKRFMEYTGNYDMSQPKIALKASHTYRVAALCEQIAASLGMSEEEQRVARMCGLLHDIGRFEQIRRYNTFSDADSVDHALLSVEILFGEGGWEHPTGMIREFWKEASFDRVLYKAIGYHSAYRLPLDLTEQEKCFCDILRDADKIDIFRVNLETPLEEIYNATTDEVYHADVTEEVMDAFREKHAILRSLKKTPADHVVGHISLFYELVYPISREIAIEQGYFMKLVSFPSKNEHTRQVFEEIRLQLKEQLT